MADDMASNRGPWKQSPNCGDWCSGGGEGTRPVVVLRASRVPFTVSQRVRVLTASRVLFAPSHLEPKHVLILLEAPLFQRWQCRLLDHGRRPAQEHACLFARRKQCILNNVRVNMALLALPLI